MNKLHISDDARQDLVEIKQYIAEDLDSCPLPAKIDRKKVKKTE